MDRYEMVTKLANKLVDLYRDQVHEITSFDETDYKTRLRKIIDLTQEFDYLFKNLIVAVPVPPTAEEKKKCCCKD